MVRFARPRIAPVAKKGFDQKDQIALIGVDARSVLAAYEPAHSARWSATSTAGRLDHYHLEQSAQRRIVMFDAVRRLFDWDWVAID